jgi:hypothetical protein
MVIEPKNYVSQSHERIGEGTPSARHAGYCNRRARSIMMTDTQTTDLIEDILIELCVDFDHWFGSDPDFDDMFAEQGGVHMLGLIIEAGAWLAGIPSSQEVVR